MDTFRNVSMPATGHGLLLLTCLLLSFPALTERPSRRTSSLIYIHTRHADISTFTDTRPIYKLHCHIPEPLDSKTLIIHPPSSLLHSPTCFHRYFTPHTVISKYLSVPHTQLASVADLFRNRSVAVDHFGAPSHAVQPLRLVNVILSGFQAPTSSTNTAARLSGSIPLQHRIIYDLSKHDDSTLHLAAQSLIARDAKQAAGAVLAEVFRHKPQFQTLANLEFALKPANYQHLNLTGLPASQSCQASPAGYINSKLQISGQATQTDSRERRTDHSLKTELSTNFQGVDSIDLVKAKDGRLIFADVAFINDSMAAAAWTYKAAPLVPLSIREGARGHLHIKKSAAEVYPPWSKEQAQVKATSTVFVGMTSPQCADLVADRAMDLYNAFGANSPEVNSWEVTGCAGTKPKSASDVLLQTTGVRNVHGLLAMHTVTFVDGMSISFHPVAGGVKREQDKFSFVVHGVSAAVDIGR